MGLHRFYSAVGELKTGLFQWTVFQNIVSRGLKCKVRWPIPSSESSLPLSSGTGSDSKYRTKGWQLGAADWPQCHTSWPFREAKSWKKTFLSNTMYMYDLVFIDLLDYILVSINLLFRTILWQPCETHKARAKMSTAMSLSWACTDNCP